MMFTINRSLDVAPSLELPPPAQTNRENDPENSTLLKIAACIPGIGLIINQIESKSLDEKLSKLPLPRRLRSDPMLGNILNENASPEEIRTACERAIQLKLIERDYTKAALVNSLLTVALTVYALAMKVIPSFVAGILIGGFSLTTAIFAFVLHTDHSIKRYERVGAASL